jgi:MT0933-like antitoxin protein
MGLSGKFKDLRSKAEEAVVERKDQIQETVQKVGEAADQRTGGKYHEHIEKAGAKATGFVDGLGDQEPKDTPAPTEAADSPEATPPPAA